MSTAEACQRNFEVRSELGLHARPAGQLVQIANGYQASLEVRREDDQEWVDGRSILSLLSLAAGEGTLLCARASGADAEALLDAIALIFEAPTLAQGESA